MQKQLDLEGSEQAGSIGREQITSEESKMGRKQESQVEDCMELEMEKSRRQLETWVWHLEERGRWIRFEYH